MLLDMAPGSKAPASFQHRHQLTAAALLLIVCVTLTKSAPTTYEIESKRTDLADYFSDPNGCYYNYRHYEEGDRIVTNEPCLNCTCHNRMLMCYLRVCPFSKAIGQDCTVQKSPDQCCPVISCPEVPVQLLTSSTTQKPTTTTVGWRDDYGCMMNENGFYPDGAQVPSDPKKPCELCYCIRNRTACVMQECTLHVEGCRPVYQEGVCCPVRYDCDYENEKSTTSSPQITGGLVFSTTSAPFDCRVNDEVYRDGESIAMVSDKPCEHCYCMRGDIVCAVQDCGEPLRGKDCTPETPPAGQCCPTSYQCANETLPSYDATTLQPASQSDSDENEAEKNPSNEDAYEKLGEQQQDNTNDDDNDNLYTTQANINEVPSVQTSDQTTNKVEETQHSVPDSQNSLSTSDDTNKINEGNKEEISSDKPELTNQAIPVYTESDKIELDTTDKPLEASLVNKVQPTELAASDPPLNENVVNPTTETISNENDKIKISEGNSDNEIPTKNPSQDNLEDNELIVTTENSAESETKIPNLQDKPQDEIQQQTDMPAVLANEPIKPNSDEIKQEQNTVTKPQTETKLSTEKEPSKPTNVESTESFTEDSKTQTVSPFNEAIEQTTQKLTQNDVETKPVEESNSQTDISYNIEQDLPDTNHEEATQIPQEDNLQTEVPTSVEQDSLNTNNPQLESTVSTEIPQIENEPVEQNKPSVEGSPQTENQSDLEKKPVEQNQNSQQNENVPVTEFPTVDNDPTGQNAFSTEISQPESEKPIELNQDASQGENIPTTEVPNVENEPSDNKVPAVEKTPQTENKLESEKKPVELSQDGVKGDNEFSTEVPKVDNELSQHNDSPMENYQPTESQLELEKTSVEPSQEPSQDTTEGENVSPTEVPNVENKPNDNKLSAVEGVPPTGNQPESETKPSETSQDATQGENVPTMEIPNVENEPADNKVPAVESNSQTENHPEPEKKPQQNQDDLQGNQEQNTSPTDIPSKLNEPQSENNVQENAPSKPALLETPENEISTEQPLEDNNIFVVSPTSPPLFSQNQVKGDEPTAEATSIANDASSSENYISTENNEDKITERPQASFDDGASNFENDNTENILSASSTENTPENNEASQQINDENVEHSTETKPVKSDVNSDVSNGSPISSNEQAPVGDDNKNDRFGANSDSALVPTTEINHEINTESEIANQGVTVNDFTSQANQPTDEHSTDVNHIVPDADSVEHQNVPQYQTEIPTEVEKSTNKNPSSIDENVYDATTVLPQQQLTDNNIPGQSDTTKQDEPVKLKDEIKTPTDVPDHNTPEKTSNNEIPTIVPLSENNVKSTDSPALNSEDTEQSVSTQTPEKDNEQGNVTPYEQLQGGNINEVIEQTTVYQDVSGDNNNINVGTDLNQNNEATLNPSSEKIEVGTNVQDKPLKNENDLVENKRPEMPLSVEENQESSDNAVDGENSVTTIKYVEESSITPTTYAPNKAGNVEDEKQNEELTHDSIQTNAVNSQSQNVNSDETSTQSDFDESSTNAAIHDSSNININNNVENDSNAPTDSKIPSEVNLDSVTEPELYTTQSTVVEKDETAINSNQKPINDATMTVITDLPAHNNNSEINANEIVSENSSQSPQNDSNSSASKTPDYVIDITTTISSSESPNYTPESIKTEEKVTSVNEVTTLGVDQNNDVTTELYENAQPGVPGEGSCLIDFVTYAHKAEVPKSNPCHEKCECLNSIVTCTSVNCPPAPPQHKNCIPLHPGNESWCCPTYMCEGGIEGVLFESHNQLGSPQLISTVVLEDKPGEGNTEKLPSSDEIPVTFNPLIPLELSTLEPSKTDVSSIIDSQDAVGVTDTSVQTEIPLKQTENSAATDNENSIEVTTFYPGAENESPVVSDQVTDNEKPVENNRPTVNDLLPDSDKPVEGDKLVENDKPVESDKPVVSDKPDESDKPAENDQPTENDKFIEKYQTTENYKPTDNDQSNDEEKPVENNQPIENDKPIDVSDTEGFTTVSYTSDPPSTTVNKQETINNIEEVNPVLSSGNESHESSSPSIEPSSYETTITNIVSDNNQNQPEQNLESDDMTIATTYKPNDSVVKQQVDDKKPETEESQPITNEEANLKPAADATSQLTGEINPLEATQIPAIVADEKPALLDNNANGVRPTSIDDIISSVNLVKDAIKNSLETSSKPTEIEYPTTVGVFENDQTTVIQEDSASPSSEESNEPQSTLSTVNAKPELATDELDVKISEKPTATESSDDVGTTQIADLSPSVSSAQEVLSETPLNIPSEQEISSSPNSFDENTNKPEETVDNQNTEVTTQYSTSYVEQNLTSNAQDVPTDSVASNLNNESNTNTHDASSQEIDPSVQQGVTTSDSTNKPYAEESPITESPVMSSSDANVDKTVEISTPIATSQPSTDYSTAGVTEFDDKRFGAPSSTPAQSEPVVQEDNKRPQESAGDMVHIPFDTETPSSKPPSSTPLTSYTSKPSFTPIPQSTWTQKPFHQESTSEASQPEQGFPDEYDDENEAVFGPGTCRYGGKIYVSAQQVPRDDPCDFCFCFRGDIICLQQSCPPPIFGCYQENIQGFCCPRYECPVAQATSVNVTTTTTTTTTTVPPHFFANAYRGAARRAGCLIHGHAYRVGEDVGIASGPCLECICGADGKMKCDPKSCSPEPLLRKMMAEAVDQRR